MVPAISKQASGVECDVWIRIKFHYLTDFLNLMYSWGTSQVKLSTNVSIFLIASLMLLYFYFQICYNVMKTPIGSVEDR